MRVALIIYGPLDTVSGGYLYDRRLVERLRQRGHHVDVVSLPWRGYAAHLFQNVAPQLAPLLRDTPYDLVLQDELNHPSLFWFNRRFKRRHPDVPLVSIVHHLRVSEQHPAWLMPLYEWVERAYLSSVDAFIVNSRTTRDAVEEYTGPSRHIVGYPAGDRLPIYITPQQIDERSRKGMLHMLFVGNAIRRKGLHTIIDAVAMLTFTEWHLTIVAGPKSDETHLAKLSRRIDAHGIEPHLMWHHDPTDAELTELYSSHHAFVMPSEYEGFGIVYLEAMGAGLAVIGSRAGAAKEFITHGENGYLLEPGDATALAEHITTLHRERKKLALIGWQALDTYNAHPSWDETMDSLCDFLATLGGNHG